ncbi:hypothetical protein GOBAR_AA30426 [Gossypium barbadense]|uniref:Enolpyruvate transferase domain-containing protein n=1 Tax=Gossypium barbadense TaxID=3634 RepID=A0A2P5WGR3_GOSBA|nr:hypothetical protein GOBAR_AA30426 [Gossypium barbadense]
MLLALKKLGVYVEHENDEKRAVLKGYEGWFLVEDMEGQEMELFLGNVGTAIWLFTTIIGSAGGSSSYILDSIPRMRERPIRDLVTGLKQLGGLPRGNMKLSESISSLYLSVSLMAAPLAHRDVEIDIIDKLISSPYVEMTIKVMERFGVTVDYVAAKSPVTGGIVTVEGCGTSSLQGDVKFAEVVEMMVAKVTWTKTSVTIIGPLRNSLRRKHLVKETERMVAICMELRKLRAMVEEGSNYCVITPPKKLNVTVIDTYDEHQMAMTFSLVPIAIKDLGCARKTFPEYFEILKRVTKH